MWLVLDRLIASSKQCISAFILNESILKLDKDTMDELKKHQGRQNQNPLAYQVYPPSGVLTKRADRIFDQVRYVVGSMRDPPVVHFRERLPDVVRNLEGAAFVIAVLAVIAADALYLVDSFAFPTQEPNNLSMILGVTTVHATVQLLLSLIASPLCFPVLALASEVKSSVDTMAALFPAGDPGEDK
jgi:hypothetical protein